MSASTLRLCIVALLALGVIGLAAWRIEAPMRGLAVTPLAVGDTPATLFEDPAAAPGPAVVIAHGFAGSRQLMHPFAVTLARAGFRAVVFDFPGHGRHPTPLSGSVVEETGATETLLRATLEVVDAARALPGSDGRVALLGHSMASDIVVRAAQRDPAIAATVAVSLFSPVVRADSPRNLLIVVGDWEPGALKDEGRRVLAQIAGPDAAVEGRTFGDPKAGTARRLVFADAAEHIAVLYDRESLVEARDWLALVFERPAQGAPDGRGPWLALMILGLVVLAWPMSRLLPVAAQRRAGASLPWRRLWPVLLGPAVLTPAILWPLPTDFLPVLVGDYLALHFGLYGILTALALWLATRAGRADRPVPARGWAILVGGAVVAGYSVLILGGALERYFASFWPIPERFGLVAAMLAGTLPFFLAVEWLTRGEAPARLGHVAAKGAFLASLAIAVALDLENLFFLIIILPAILVFFLIYGLFAHWAYARARHPAVGAIGNAVALAWALAVTFPLLDG